MHSVEISIRTLTPLFTGGINGQSDTIHETGIMGSLRWWYEAIVRGLGGSACDPVNNKCNFNIEEYKKVKEVKDERVRLNKSGLCDVCQIFGATGWKRRFQLEIINSDIKLTWNNKASIKIKPHDRTGGWYLPPGLTGKFKLILKGDKEIISLLTSVIMFLEKWGGLGSKQQLGYGIFQIEHISDSLEKFQWNVIGEKEIGHLPDFRTFTFFKLCFNPSGSDWWMALDGFRKTNLKEDGWSKLRNLSNKHMIPVSPLLKNYLRFRKNWSHYDITNWFFGNIKKNDKQRSKINLSWAYINPDSKEWEIRGWAFFPQDNRGKKYFYELRTELKKEFENIGKWYNMLKLPDRPTGRVYYYPEDSAWKIRRTGEVVKLLRSFNGEDKNDKQH